MHQAVDATPCGVFKHACPLFVFSSSGGKARALPFTPHIAEVASATSVCAEAVSDKAQQILLVAFQKKMPAVEAEL